MTKKAMRYLGAFFCIISGLSSIEALCERPRPFLCRKYLEDAFYVTTGKALHAEEIFDLARLALGKEGRPIKVKEKASIEEGRVALSLIGQEWDAIVSYTIKKISQRRDQITNPIKVILGGGIIDYNQDILKTMLAKKSIPRGIEFIFSTLGDVRAILGAVTYAHSVCELFADASHRYAIGIDLGGTHIRVALIDTVYMQVVGGVLKQKLFPCSADAKAMTSFSTYMLKNKRIDSFSKSEQMQHGQLANVVLTSIANLVKKAAAGKGIAFVAMSSAGEFTDDGYCKRAVFLPFSGVHVRKELEKMVGLPVIIAHDVFCGALGEKTFGVGRDIKQFVFVVLGTFIGVQLFNGETWDCKIL
jgi:predicted NBD/HSP70 family sugar kinase